MVTENGMNVKLNVSTGYVLTPVPNVNKFSFTCYGTPCEVQLDNSLKFKLKDISENTIADAWLQLSSEYSDLLLDDCLKLSDKLALGDWSYYCLLRDLSEQFLGKNTNEATLMQIYLLAQSGYKARIGHKKGRLVLLLPAARSRPGRAAWEKL